MLHYIISQFSEKGEVLLRGVGTLRYLLILGDISACRVPICAVAARWFDNPRQKLLPRSRIPRSTSHFSCIPRHEFLWAGVPLSPVLNLCDSCR